MRTAEHIYSNDFVGIASTETVASLIGKMQAHVGQIGACILEDNALIGVFSPEKLLKSRIDIASMKVGKLARHVPQLKRTDDLLAVAGHMYDANASMLPLVENDVIIGVVHVLDVLKHIRNLPEMKNILVRNIRHPRPLTLNVNDRIDTALSIMHDEHIDRLPVVDGNGNIAGFVSYRDVIERYYAHHVAADAQDRHMRSVTKTKAFEANRPQVPGLPVSNIMNTEIITINEDEAIGDVIDKMIAHQVHSLLILDKQKPIGIVTQRDVLEAVIASQVPQSNNVRFIGLDELDVDSYLRIQIRRIAAHHMKKIEHFLNAEHEAIVHIKEYQRAGDRHKFSVHLRITMPGTVIPSTNAHAWNIRTALQDAFSRLEAKLQPRKSAKRRISIRTALF